MRLTRIALYALTVSVLCAAARGGDKNPANQASIDASLTSIIAQRTFAGVLPSIADYSQTAHSVLKDGEYCPVDSLTGASYCQPGAKWVMWDTPFMQFDKMDGQGKYSGWDMDMSGFGTGIGRMLGDTTVVGLAVGWDARKTDMDSAPYAAQYMWGNESGRLWGKDRSDAFHAALYGGTAIGCFFVDAYAGFSRTWHRTRGDYSGAGNDGQLFTEVSKRTAKYDDTVYSAGVKASYVWILPNEMRITSSLGLDYGHLKRGKVKIKSSVVTTYDGEDPTIVGPVFRPVKKVTHNSLQAPISIAVNKTFQSDFLAFKGKPSWWTPEIRAAYTPQFGKKRISGTAVDADGAALIKIKSAELDSYATVGAGVKIKLADKYIFAVDYDYRFGRDYKSHLLTGTYGVSF